jgi:hypothetical protein
MLAARLQLDRVKFFSGLIDMVDLCALILRLVAKFFPSETVRGVIIDHANRLHECIHDRAADKLEAPTLQVSA